MKDAIRDILFVVSVALALTGITMTVVAAVFTP